MSEYIARFVASGALEGVNVAFLALMAGVTWQLSRAALVDLSTALLAIAGAVLLFRYRLNSAWLVLGRPRRRSAVCIRSARMKVGCACFVA